MSKEQLKRLRTAIVHRPPFCSGTIAASPDALTVFYGKESSARRIQFPSATSEELEHLSQTCDPATFGLGDEDVMDNSYRKAGKLDSAHFAVKIDLDAMGLLGIIRTQLLEGKDESEPIRAELYKLNVYGKDSFFKSHKDTPRSETMFGSLVVVYPTQHDGGALALRLADKEWVFDSVQAIQGHQGPCLAYVAFFSDVEHEVALVKAGYRVTVTYNLYFVDPPSVQSLLPSISANALRLKQELSAMLDDPTFLPEGGTLGVGLRHEYPLSQQPEQTDTLNYLSSCLKGSDMDVANAFKALSLEIKLGLLYNDQEGGEAIVYSTPIGLDGAYIEGSLCHYLQESYGAALVAVSRWRHRQMKPDLQIHWIQRPSTLNMQKNTYVAYGNEAQAKLAYGRVTMTVKIGKPGQRATSIQG